MQTHHDGKDAVRIAAIGDIHCTKGSQGTLQPLFAQVVEQADVMVLTGDLTDYGTPEEAQILATELKVAAKIPVVAVLGNHDFESGQQDEVRKILTEAGVKMLDGETVEIHGVGFAGVKGFFGGFGVRSLQAWGEASIKHLVQDAVDEALKLERALGRVRSERKVAVLHYAPIVGTVEGEPQEIYPFLGTSRLEEPLNRYNVTAVFHGHAHRGSPDGKTSTGVPVYNVAMALLRNKFPDKPPFRIVKIPAAKAASSKDGHAGAHAHSGGRP